MIVTEKETMVETKPKEEQINVFVSFVLMMYGLADSFSVSLIVCINLSGTLQSYL